MSELEKLFSEQTGSPANQQAKKIAQEKSRAAKNKKQHDVFFTQKDNKIVQITIKKTGAYSSFVMKKPKPGSETYEAKSKEMKILIAGYQKQGKWIDETSYEEKVSELIAKA